MRIEFAGRTVVVTGGTGALGGAVVAQLLDAGAHCVVPVFDEAEIQRCAFKDDDRALLRAGVDLRDEQQVEAFYDSVDDLWASVQVAGGFAMARLAQTDAELWRGMFELNATTCFLCCREAVRRIRSRSDAEQGGRLVNVAARPAIVPTGGLCAYAASKAAVANLTLSLAEELAAERIWVNAVAPSIMDTPANRKAMPEADHSAWPSVEAVAQTVVFLASPQNQASRSGLVPVYGAA